MAEKPPAITENTTALGGVKKKKKGKKGKKPQRAKTRRPDPWCSLRQRHFIQIATLQHHLREDLRQSLLADRARGPLDVIGN